MHLSYQTAPDRSSGFKPPRSPSGGRGGKAASSFLGNTHEITAPPPDDKTAMHRRLERFELQSIASKILKSVTRKRRDGSSMSPRVCDCLHKMRSKNVEVWKSAKNSLHYYGGLVVCGSVWDCLPCAQKVSEKRAAEIKQAVESWEAQGGSVQMVTLTFPHYENQKCKPLRDKFQDARRLMKHRPSYKSLMKQIGLIGEINRTEVTYGQNGWHIHCHTILFTEGKTILSPGAIFPMWANACESVGLPSPSRAHGVTISTPSQIADYIAKQGKETSNWTLEKEMTKGHIKRGGKEGLTPFDLLRAYRDTKQERFADLFREYSTTFKGTRQLVWSRGLKSRFLIDDITDEEAAENHDEMDEILALIPPKLWAFIREKNYRGKLLEAANISPEVFAQALDVLKTSAGYVDYPF